MLSAMRLSSNKSRFSYNGKSQRTLIITYRTKEIEVALFLTNFVRTNRGLFLNLAKIRVLSAVSSIVNKTLVTFTLVQIAIRVYTAREAKCFARRWKIEVMIMTVLKWVDARVNRVTNRMVLVCCIFRN